MTYFVAYDIADSDRRVKIASILDCCGVRIQYSFFKCEIEKSVLEKLKRDILPILDENEDRFFIYPVCDKCNKNIIELGQSFKEESDSYSII